MNIASYIDHTILKPTATTDDVRKLCEEALQYQFAAVCVPPYFVAYAQKQLQHSTVKVATVIGFPFGYSSTSAKLEEIKDALADGADELDMVINIAALKSGDREKLSAEVQQCAALIHASNKCMKLIVESGELTDNELIACCKIVAEHQVDFIKTSTGYSTTGATLHAVRLMRQHLPNTQIKASGGIRNFATAQEMIAAGANRIGCSASIAIVQEASATP